MSDFNINFFDDNLTAVDEADPIYQAVAAAMAQRGITPPDPNDRPPELIPARDGDAPGGHEPADAGQTPPGVNPRTSAEDIASALAASTEGSTDATTDGQATPKPTVDAGTDAGAGAASGDAGDDGGSGDSSPASPDSPAAAPIRVTVGDQDYDVSNAEVAQLIELNNWMNSLPRETLAAWGGIQEGTHVALSREEYAKLTAQPAAPTTPLPPPASTAPTRPDLSYLDDDARAYIERLEATQPAVPTTPTATPDAGPSPADIAAYAQHQAERTVANRQRIGEITTEYATKYELTPEQIERLNQVTSELGVVPTIAQRHAVYSPTGQLIREADIGEVVREAYAIAMASDPSLRQVHEDMIYNQRLAATQAANDVVNGKKALAGSLASAPSATVPSGKNDLVIGPGNTMNMQATSEAIAAFITESQRNGS